MSGGKVVGVPVLRPLDSVRPNGYNPNVQAPHVYASLLHGLQTDGWLASQALLVWGTDEGGSPVNLIIDGEHRWRAARDLGMTEGPMVFLHGVTAAKAKALTVAMNQRRGEFDEEGLSALLHSLDQAPGVEALSLDLGLSVDYLESLLSDGSSSALEGAPHGPVLVEEEKVKADVRGKSLRVIITCEDMAQLAAVAELCKTRGWAYEEDFS